MKFKNVHFVMRHFEKIVLGAGVVFFLIVAWLVVLGSPYTATISQEEDVRPSQVEERVLEQADRLKRKINDSLSPLPDIPVPPYTSMFRERIDRAPLSVASLEPLSKPGLSGPFVFEEPRQKVFTVPQPPAPELTGAQSAFGVLPPHDELAGRYAAARIRQLGDDAADRLGAQVAADLAYLVPQQTPRDFRYVTVGGGYDLDAWRLRLREVDGVPIPEPWWRNMLLLTDVLLERQTLDIRTGQWSEAKVIEPLPDVFNPPREAKTWLSNEAQQIVKRLQDHQDRISRPPFIPMSDAAVWIPPDLPEARGDDSFIEPDEETGSETGAESDSQASLVPAGFSADVAGASGPQRLALWAHDLTVVPGQTYRYRMTVRLFNPLFQRRTLADEQRDQYFHALWLESEPSTWSAPVSIDPEQQFFVIDIAARRRSATVEAWRVFNAQPYATRFSVSPGDPMGGSVTIPIGDEEVQVDLDLGAIMVDLVNSRGTGPLAGRASRMIYLDTQTNLIRERSLEDDRDSPERGRLLEMSPSASAVPIE